MGWRIQRTTEERVPAAPSAGYANPASGVTVSDPTTPFTPVTSPHGTDIAEQPQKAQWAGRIERAKNARHRHRYTIKPWAVLGGLPTFTETLHLVPGQPVIKIGAPLLATVIVAAVQWTRRDTPHERAFAVACTIYGGAWAAWAVLAGLFHGFVLLALLAGWAPASFLWWDRYMVRTSKPAPQPAEKTPPADTIRERWDTHVDVPSLFPGARLDPPKAFDGGRSYLIRGIPGKHTTSRFEQRREDIASALGLHLDRITIESVTEHGEDRTAANAQLLVMDEKNPQTVGRNWEGPTLNVTTGVCAPAYYPDGEPVRWRLFKVEDGHPNRAINSNISGNTGTGKSRFVDLLVLERMYSGLFVQWWIDGKEGQSSPALAQFVDWPAVRRDEWFRMLCAAWKVMQARRRYLTTLTSYDEDGDPVPGVEYFPASPEFPFLQIVVDEAQEVMKDPRCMRLLKLLLKQGNSCGIGVDLISQIMIQTELGETDAINAGAARTLSKDNIAAFRADDNSAAMVTIGPRMQVNPQDLPPAPGYAYMASDSMRRMRCRTVYASKSFRYWAKRAEQASLDALSVQVADTEGYSQRFERRSQQEAETAAGNFGDLDADLAAALGERQPGQDAPGTTEQKLGTKQAVFKAIRDAGGPIKREDVIVAVQAMGVDVKERQIADVLSWWCDHKHVVRREDMHGYYDLTARVESAEAADNPNVTPIHR